MAMAIHLRPPSKWSHNQIILATMLGTLIAVTIGAFVSIGLAPARISFSIAGAVAAGNNSEDDTKFYNFTLVARNSSPRMAVLYGALDAEIWLSTTAWVPALVDRAALPDRRTQPPDNVTKMSVSGEYWQSKQVMTPPPAPGAAGAPATNPPPTSSANKTDWCNCTVVVIAKVWFKAGAGISTRSYDVRASCPQVIFKSTRARKVINCTTD